MREWFHTLAVALTVVVATCPALAQERLALLIGNKNYSTSVGALTNPHKDIALVGASLQHAKFTVLPLVRDASRRQILGEVTRFARKLQAAGPGAIGFLYYSGHGLARPETRRNYVLPIDMANLVDEDAWYDAVALDDILATLVGLAGQANLFVVLDACRTEVLLPYKAVTMGFEPVNTANGVFLAFSTSPNRLASDKGASSGPYAAALAAELRMNSITHTELFENVKRRVYRITNGIQRPEHSNGLVDPIYFGNPPMGANAAAPLSREQLTDLARAISEGKVRNNALLEYLQRTFPQSDVATASEIALAKIAREAIVDAERAQRENLPDWNRRKREVLAPEELRRYVPVVFGTNRDVPQSSTELAVTDTAGSLLTLGYADTKMPDFSKAEPYDRRPRLTALAVFTEEEELTRNLKRHFSSEKEQRVLVFVPGSNLSFAQAVAKTASIASGSDFKGLPVLFTWPTSSQVFDYYRDVESAKSSRKYLRSFVDLIASVLADKKISFIAEGMGARVLAEAVFDVGQPPTWGRDAQWIFLAPDMEMWQFDAVRRLVASKITLYVSQADPALKARKFLTGEDALGALAGDKVPVFSGVDTIDVTDAPLSEFDRILGNVSGAVLRDIGNLLRETTPRQRVTQSSGGNQYWTLRKGTYIPY